MAKTAAPKKKGKGKAVFLIITVLLVFGLLALIYGYIDFEFNKIGEAGVTPLSDWRSYLAFLLSKIPFVKNYIKYEPRQIIKPSTYYTEIYEAYIEKIDKDRQELEKRASELNQTDQKQRALQAELSARTQELNLKEERLLAEIQSWQDQNSKFQQFADWLTESEAVQMAEALRSTSISVEEIVSGLRLVDAAIAAEIVGALALVDSNKAAQVLANLAGKEVIK